MPETLTPPTARFRPTPLGTQRVRIDQGSARGSDLAPGRGSLLRAFGAWSGRAARAVRSEDRRAEPRHGQVECQAWVGWRSWRRFHTNNALVIDISRGGARIFLDKAPPTKRPVWVFLETPGQKAIVKARVAGVESTPSGQCLARVAFHEPCPFAFFEAAVCGLAAIDPKVRATRIPRVAAAIRA